MKKRISIAARKHRFHVCRQDDVVIDGGTFLVAREGLYVGWGALELKSGSFYGKNGAVVEESRNTVRGTIWMRYRPDVLISDGAWIYEERLQSAPRWFKILSVQEDIDGDFVFAVRPVERGDDVLSPVVEKPATVFSPVAQTPGWVK